LEKSAISKPILRQANPAIGVNPLRSDDLTGVIERLYSQEVTMLGMPGWRVVLIIALCTALFWRIRCFIESIMR
jgi:hypothetical protein